MSYWLLESSALNDLRAAYASAAANGVPDISAAGFGGDILSVNGDVATIAVTGVLTPEPDIIAAIFMGGNTAYSDIMEALAKADSDSRVDRITLAIDSPGGSVSGLFETIAALQAIGKPITAEVGSQASSAAYAIAAQADKITARTRASRIGSIGVVATFAVDNSRVSVTSTEAPNKRPDPTTEDGAAVIREELDALHALFVEAIADGRGTTVETVNATYGRGAVLLADAAKDRGMIDAVAKPALRVVKSTPDTQKTTESTAMDLETLKAQHPSVYAEAVAEGREQERDRVSAHLTMGEASGAMETAITAIKDGRQMTAALSAEYMAAGLRRRDTEARHDDDAEAASAADGAAQDTASDEASEVVALVEQHMGVASHE